MDQPDGLDAVTQGQGHNSMSSLGDGRLAVARLVRQLVRAPLRVPLPFFLLPCPAWPRLPFAPAWLPFSPDGPSCWGPRPPAALPAYGSAEGGRASASPQVRLPGGLRSFSQLVSICPECWASGPSAVVAALVDPGAAGALLAFGWATLLR